MGCCKDKCPSNNGGCGLQSSAFLIIVLFLAHYVFVFLYRRTLGIILLYAYIEKLTDSISYLEYKFYHYNF